MNNSTGRYSARSMYLALPRQRLYLARTPNKNQKSLARKPAPHNGLFLAGQPCPRKKSGMRCRAAILHGSAWKIADSRELPSGIAAAAMQRRAALADHDAQPLHERPAPALPQPYIAVRSIAQTCTRLLHVCLCCLPHASFRETGGSGMWLRSKQHPCTCKDDLHAHAAHSH